MTARRVYSPIYVGGQLRFMIPDINLKRGGSIGGVTSRHVTIGTHHNVGEPPYTLTPDVPKHILPTISGPTPEDSLFSPTTEDIKAHPAHSVPAAHQNHPRMVAANLRAIFEYVLGLYRAEKDPSAVFLLTVEKILANDKRLGATPGRLKDFLRHTKPAGIFGPDQLDLWLQWRFPKWSKSHREKLIEAVLADDTSALPPRIKPASPSSRAHEGRTFNVNVFFKFSAFFSPTPNTFGENPLRQRVLEISDELHGKSFEQLIALFVIWLERDPQMIVDAIEWAVGTQNKAVAKALVAFQDTNPTIAEPHLKMLPVFLHALAISMPNSAYGMLIHHLLQDRASSGYGLLDRYKYYTNLAVMAKLSLLAGEHTVDEEGYHGTRTS